MPADGTEEEVAKPIEGQLAIDVPLSPGAIGRWTLDDQFAAYAREKGADKAVEQKRLAEEAGLCNCGEQAKEDAKAVEEGRRAKRIAGHLHRPGCPQLRLHGGSAPRISKDEQIRRYTGSFGA